MNNIKLVSIITVEVRDNSGAIVQYGGLAVRVPRRLAEIQVDRGFAAYTSKGKHKQLIKSKRKQKRREAILLARRKAIQEAKIGHKRKPI